MVINVNQFIYTIIFISHGLAFGIDWIIRKKVIIVLHFIDDKLKATEIKQNMEFLTVKNRTENSDLPSCFIKSLS